MTNEIKQRIAQLNKGEIPAGYKKTDFGVFPCDWITDKTFGDLFDFFGGLSKSREELGDKGIPYLHYGDMHRGTFSHVSYEQYEQLPKYDMDLKGNESYLMSDGDIAFLDASEDLSGTSRAVMIDNPENKLFAAGLHIILAKEKSKTLSKHYKQYLTMPHYIEKQFQSLASGFKVYGLNRNTLPRIRIAFPASHDEQKRIAEILMKFDESIILQERMIEALKKQKKYYLSKMFPAKGSSVPEIRFSGFTGAWEQRKLGDITDSYSGGTPSVGVKEYYDGDIPFIRSAEINSSSTELFITQEGLANSSARMADVGDILYALYGATSGEVGCARLKGAVNQAILVIQPHLGYCSEFLMQWLRKSKQTIVDTYLQGGQGNLSGAIVKNIIVDCPSEEEQITIGTFFRNLDNLITLHQRELEKIHNQRKTMMQLLLLGIVRVAK